MGKIKKDYKILYILLGIILLSSFSFGLVATISSGNFTIKFSSISGGGGNLSSTNYKATTSIAQTIISSMINTTNYNTSIGFYYVAYWNRLPSIPANLRPANNSWHIFYNKTIMFDWDNSTDDDYDNLTYEFQFANGTSFNQDYLIVNYTGWESNYTLNSTALNVTWYYWRVRAFDGINFSNFTDRYQLEVTYAKLNITYPYYDQILTINNIYTVNISEIDNGVWVNRVEYQAIGDSIEATVSMNNLSSNEPDGPTSGVSSYTANYTIPDINSTYVTLVARGYNGSLIVNATSRVIITRPVDNVTIRAPRITYLCGLPTYVSLDNITNITIKSDLDVLLKTINVTLTDPDSISWPLAKLQDNEYNYKNTSYDYNHNYSFLANKTGTYQLYLTITDVNNEIATRNISIYSDNPVNFNLTGINLTSMELRDICDNRLITSGSSIAGGYPRGQYNLVSKANKPYIDLINATLNESLRSVCYFDDPLDTIATPGDTIRAVDQFQFNCTESGIKFDKMNLTYNYNSLVYTIFNENFLKLYKCFTKDSCTWVNLTANIRASEDLIESELISDFSNYSMFMVGEEVLIRYETVTQTTTTAPSTGSRAYSAIDIIHPGKLTLYANDSITTPIIVWNKGTIDLSGIVISTESNNPALILSLDKSRIESLTVNNQETVRLTIKPLTEIVKGGNYEVTVYADVTSPVIRDSVKIYIDILGEEIMTGKGISAQLQFARDLFNNNQECSVLNELLDQAEAAYNNGEYSKAQSLIDAAIQSCRDILELNGKQLEIPKLGLSDSYIITAELITFLIIFGLAYNYYKRRRLIKKFRKM